MNKRSLAIVLAVAAFIYLVVSMVALYLGLLTTKDLVAPLLSLSGTFLGAVFAFNLNREREENKLNQRRQEALNRACFALIMQANAIRQLKLQFEPFPNKIVRALSLPALKPPAYEHVRVDLGELDFLLSSENPGVLLNLAIEHERFHQAITTVLLRADFYVNEFQKKFAEVGGSKLNVNVGELKGLLGERIFQTLVSSTDLAFEHLSACDESIPKMLRELQAVAKVLYPKNKFVNYVMPDHGQKSSAI